MPQAANDDRTTGFQANLSGASLPDLVQMECLAHTEGVFRVTSTHDVGYLFFRSGNVVHAISGSAVGQSAALEILAWKNGTFERCHVGWPDAPTIQTAWQNLLLLSAQAQDESGRHKLVRLTPGTSGGARLGSVPPKKPDRPEKPYEALSTMPPGYQALVRLDPSGNQLEARGHDASEFAAAVAYAARIGQLIADSLCLDQLLAVECNFSKSRYIVEVDRSGAILGVKAPTEVDVTGLRDRAGL